MNNVVFSLLQKCWAVRSFKIRSHQEINLSRREEDRSSYAQTEISMDNMLDYDGSQTYPHYDDFTVDLHFNDP